MLTLYTAIGNYRLTEKGLPLITAADGTVRWMPTNCFSGPALPSEY